MESAATQAEGQAEANTAASPQSVTLHILSPSPQAPHRFTFDELPLSTKVSEIKARITLAVPSRPDPESQRLIYKGKVLANNEETLENTIDPPETRVHSIHLVLPPSAIPNERPTFGTSTPPPALPSSTQNLSRSPAGLRFRGSEYEAPGDRLTNFLRDCNEELDSTTSALPDSLQRPAAASNTTQPLRPGSVPRFSTLSHEENTSTNPTYATETTIPRGTAAQFQPPSTNSPNQPNPLYRPYQQYQLNNSPLYTPPGRVSLQQLPNHVQRRPEARTMSYYERSSSPSFLLQRITTMENQVRAGVAPNVDEISHVRFQLLRLLDERYRDPHGPRDTPLEAWLTRLSTAAVRADQLRRGVSDTQAPSTQLNTAAAASNVSSVPMYLLSSPDGHRGVVMPSNDPSRNSSQNLGRPVNLETGAPTIGGRRRPQPPAAPTIRFRFRPEAPNAQRVRRVILTGADFSRLLRGLWLFVRLSFFCYLLTQHGTWSRIILFILAAIVAIVSQTHLPHRAQTALWDPVRRHLERLVSLDVQRPGRPTQGTNNADNRRPSDGFTPNQNLPATDVRVAAPEHTTASVIRRSVTGAERGVVLFLATLIPGIGERYVATRNAADAARREEDRRRQGQEENERQQQNGSAPGPAPDSQDDAVAGSSSRTAANSPGQSDGPGQALQTEPTSNQHEHAH